MIPLRAVFLTIIIIIEVGSQKGISRSAKYRSVDHCVNPKIAYVLKLEENRRIELYCNPPKSSCDFETNTCVEKPEEEIYRVPNQCFEQSLAFLLRSEIRDYLPLECGGYLPVCDFEKNMCVGEHWGSSRPLKEEEVRRKIQKVSSSSVESNEVSEERINQDNDEDGDYY